jgi:hypothetical protein
MQIVAAVKVFVVLARNGCNYISNVETGGLRRTKTVAGYQADASADSTISCFGFYYLLLSKLMFIFLSFTSSPSKMLKREPGSIYVIFTINFCCS